MLPQTGREEGLRVSRAAEAQARQTGSLDRPAGKAGPLSCCSGSGEGSHRSLSESDSVSELLCRRGLCSTPAFLLGGEVTRPSNTPEGTAHRVSFSGDSCTRAVTARRWGTGRVLCDSTERGSWKPAPGFPRSLPPEPFPFADFSFYSSDAEPSL